MIRFVPTRLYFSSAAVALGLTAFSAWCATSWLPAVVPAILFLASAALILTLAFQPILEVHESHLVIGKRLIPWRDIRRVDQTGWAAPLVIYITLSSREKIRVVYPGDMATSNKLLSLIQQYSAMALINGVPYRQIFGDPVPAAGEGDQRQSGSPRYRLLNEEDEAEVERLYQKLKTAGHLDPEK